MSKLLIPILLVMSSCITSVNRYYDSVESRIIIIIDKRYVPGFQNPDRYLIRVLDGNTSPWKKTSPELYKRLNLGDTLKTVLFSSI